MEFGFTEILQNYGWFILVGVIIIAYIWTKLQPSIQKFLEKRAEDEYAAKYHKNPDLLVQQLTAQQLRTERLQAQHDKDAEEFKKKQEKKEAMKREQILNGTGKQKLNVGHGYNPLMGDNTRSYKPVRKSPCGGGGCGR
ncbi:selenoprotein S B-like isoform X2 [Onthophagus taurus]|uniref:selenoprotein S B-like isoform X2 n=1 Tax=Onthophagus taurus TaxID=166361 RepID=UPI0039BE74A6